MSDMAFGGGSELLEAGHDEGNVWALLDDAMLYVPSPFPSPSAITPICSHCIDATRTLALDTPAA